MPLTILLAQLFGLYFVVNGLFALLRPKEARKMYYYVAENRTILYLLGMSATFFGLIFALSHNSWNSLQEAAVSLVGWATLLKGIAVLFAPHATLNFIRPLISSDEGIRNIAIPILIFGFYLVYVGFGV
jgi:uncharacterized protein YjeT (DUF2065 family)